MHPWALSMMLPEREPQSHHTWMPQLVATFDDEAFACGDSAVPDASGEGSCPDPAAKTIDKQSCIGKTNGHCLHRHWRSRLCTCRERSMHNKYELILNLHLSIRYVALLLLAYCCHNCSYFILSFFHLLLDLTIDCVVGFHQVSLMWFSLWILS